VMDQAYTSSRRSLLSDFRRNDRVRQLIDRGLVELGASGGRQTAVRVASVTY